MKIEIRNADFLLNDKVFTFPIELSLLVAEIGAPDRSWKSEHADVRIWEQLGLFCHLDDHDAVKSFNVNLTGGVTMDILPENTFQGNFLIDGQDFTERTLVEMEELSAHRLYHLTNDDDSISQVVYISPLEKATAPKIDPNKYIITPIDGTPIAFEDFNFKLAVIQELMYEQELLQPKFDLHEFVDWYSERKIDLEEEGYGIIPEVKAYFEALPVDQKFASKITELHQEGGQEVYMNMINFWDGEDDVFNITSVADARQFPHLKEVTLFYEEVTDVLSEFEAIGIAADYL